MINTGGGADNGPTTATRTIVVIGDVVGSREHVDQADLFGALQQHLWWVSEHYESAIVHPWTMTIGDEFQGAFRDLATALRAVLTTQLRVADLTRLRFGLGHGEVQQASDSEFPRGQSGSAWWAARSSIDRVKQLQDSKQPYRSCAFESDDPRIDGPIEAFLMLRDRVVHDLDDKDRAIALGLVLGRKQSSTAEELGIDPAAVSRRKHAHGIAALLEAHLALEVGLRWLD